jgi:very-short-patch-repair endonuclease
MLASVPLPVSRGVGSLSRGHRAGVRARELRKNSTDAERLLWSKLRNRQLLGFKFRRQVPLLHYIADFVCMDAKLIVEIDGGQHANKLQADQQRSEQLAGLGFAVIRFWNHEVLQHIDVVLEQIALSVTSLMPSPQPSPTGRGCHHITSL